jgi:hypothetical protein
MDCRAFSLDKMKESMMTDLLNSGEWAALTKDPSHVEFKWSLYGTRKFPLSTRLKRGKGILSVSRNLAVHKCTVQVLSNFTSKNEFGNTAGRNKEPISIFHHRWRTVHRLQERYHSLSIGPHTSTVRRRNCGRSWITLKTDRSPIGLGVNSVNKLVHSRIEGTWVTGTAVSHVIPSSLMVPTQHVSRFVHMIQTSGHDQAPPSGRAGPSLSLIRSLWINSCHTWPESKGEPSFFRTHSPDFLLSQPPRSWNFDLRTRGPGNLSENNEYSLWKTFQIWTVWRRTFQVGLC